MTESTFAAMIEAELEQGRRARVSEFGAEALAWLAFPPVWTDRLARDCGFPTGPLGLDEMVARAEAAGWCARRETENETRTPALRIQLLVELGELSGTPWEVRLREVEAVQDEGLRAQLLVSLITFADQDLPPLIGSAARDIQDPAAAADVLLAVLDRNRHQDETIVLRFTELSDLIARIPDPGMRAVRLLHGRELGALLPTADREIQDLLPRVTSPVLAARLLRQAAGMLPADVVSAQVERLAGVVPEVASGDLAVATATAGHFLRALGIARSITDERAARHTDAELLLPFSRAPDGTAGQAMLRGLVEMCMDEDRPADPVTTAKVVVGLAEAGLVEDAERLAYQLVLASRELRATPANIGALQRAAAAVMTAAGGSGLTLMRRSAELSGQLANAADRAACLAAAIDLARRFGLPYPLDTAPVVSAARAVHDDEDRARTLARAARLLGPREREGRRLAEEALNLAGRLDEGGPVLTFWAPDGARTEILEELRRQRGFSWVQQVTVRMGQRIGDARQRGELVPESLARWAELAAAAGADGSGQAAAALDEQMARYLRAGDTGQALAWLDTAGSLAPLLLGEFETSVAANTRRVELVHRRELDRRRLADFLPRLGQIGAFERLLDQDDDGPWALHYLGVGGVGKTTLIRHLTAELAPARDVVTSRIDFDHINPDFPRRRPAQLLLELATELESHALERRQMALFRQAYEQLQEINAAALPGTPPVAVSDPVFASAVRTFGGFLQVLDRPVVLILDTCEELEKLTPVGGRIEQLEATFALIEALHEATPRLRVVLAGRRPLARGGHGWRLATAESGQEREDQLPDVLLPDPKPYLTVHEVRGFDRAEAEEFLGPGHKGLDIGPELREAILARSPDPGAAASLEWTETPRDLPRPAEPPRYNPFDLDHYANWVRAEPALTAADIASTERDTYVESRIIGRLNHPDMERLLPAVVALGRFDRAMLRPAFDGGDQAFAGAWRELAATEWVDIQFDAALDTTFLEVDRGHRPRLESYYQRAEHRGLLLEAARRLGPGLAQLCDERPLARLGVDHVAAALRLLPPEEAARLVDRLAWKVIEEAAWGWAERVAERILADQPELGRAGHPAAAGLRAMLASALVHLDPERELADLWESVEEAARVHPDQELSDWFTPRAVIAQGEAFQGPFLAKAATESESLQEWVLEALADETDRRRRQVLLGGLLAAVQDRVDEAEAVGNQTRVLDPADLERAVLGEPAAVRAFARMLSARVLLLDARFEEAEQAFVEAAALATDPGPPPEAWLSADWAPPDDLPRRVWLEALRAPVADVGRPELGPPPIPTSHLGGIDADRLASAALRRRLGRGVVPAEELAAYERIDDLLETRRPVCEAHRAVPPFFVTVAHGWLVLGETDRALALLNSGERTAIGSRDHALERIVAAARLEVVRRSRRHDVSRSLRARRTDPAALAAVALLGPPNEFPWARRGLSPGEAHGWWRSAKRSAIRADLGPEWLDGALQAGPPSLDLTATGLFELYSLTLDYAEEQRLSGQDHRRLPSVFGGDRDTFFGRAPYWVRDHPLRTERGAAFFQDWVRQCPHHWEDGVRLELRRRVLLEDGSVQAVREALGAGVDAVGPRRVAELLLDEGELLALRLPAMATTLLNLAAILFEEAGDSFGAFAATVTAALARARAGLRPDEDATRQLEQVYEALRRDHEDSLADFVLRRDTDITLAAFRGSVWEGWLYRLLVADAWSSQQQHTLPDLLRAVAAAGFRPSELDLPPAGHAATGDLAVPRQWVEAAAAPPTATPSADWPPTAQQQALQRGEGTRQVSDEPPPATRAIPFGARRGRSAPTGEFRRPPPFEQSPESTSRARSAAPSSGRRGALAVVLAVATVGVSLAAVALVRSSGVLGSGEPGQSGMPVWAVVGLWALGAAVVGFLLWRGLPRLRRWSRARSSRARSYRRLDLGGIDVTSVGGAELKLTPYEQQDDPLVGRVRAAARAAPIPKRIALAVSSYLDPQPWEAPVLLALDDVRTPCWRDRGYVSVADPPRWWQLRAVQRFALAPDTWAGLLQGSLGGLRAVRLRAQPEWSTVDNASPWDHLLMIMGTPVQTSAGIRLRIASLARDTKIEPQQPEDLLEHALVPYMTFGLVVVIGEPREGFARVDAEREQARDLRRCAADVMDAGAGAVLCLPSMPEEVAGQVLRLLGDRLQRIRRRGWREVVATTSRIREMITAAGTTDSERAAAKELALEVTVWVRTE